MELYFAILLFAISSSITPGPNNIMVMTSALNYGIKKTIPHFLGICLGFPVMVFALGMGFAAVFLNFPILHQIIQVVGISYILYLAWKIATTDIHINKDKKSKPFTFIQAALFQWVNPKALVMSIGAISAYTEVGGNIFYEVLVISLTFFIVCLPCVGIWMFFGTTLKRFLKNETHQRVFNYIMGVLLAASIVLILFD